MSAPPPSPRAGILCCWHLHTHSPREHSGNIQGIFRDIQGTFSDHSGNIQGTFRVHCCWDLHTHGPKRVQPPYVALHFVYLVFYFILKRWLTLSPATLEIHHQLRLSRHCIFQHVNRRVVFSIITRGVDLLHYMMHYKYRHMLQR
jgi:hypothetical protein